MKTDENHEKSSKTKFLAEVGRILMKIGQNLTKFHQDSIFTNENLPKNAKIDKSSKFGKKTHTHTKLRKNIKKKSVFVD